MDNRSKRLLSQHDAACEGDAKMLGYLVLVEAMFDLFQEDHGSLTWYGLNAELENRHAECRDSELLKSAYQCALEAMREHRPR